MKSSPLKRKTPLRPKYHSTKKESLKSQKLTKEKTITQLRKQLWKLFSLFIRTRDHFTCVTCGKTGTGSQIHAGHFITGATCSPKLYFDEKNVNAQCYHCNVNLSGNWVRYEEFMIRKYGLEETNNLKLRRTLEMGLKVDTFWYEDKIKEYGDKLFDLQISVI